MHRLGKSRGDAQARETAGSAGYVDVLDLSGLSAATVEQAAHRGKKLGAML